MRAPFLVRLAKSVGHGGVLHISEECEGYAPRELQGTIAERDHLATLSRIEQAVRGLLGL